LATAAPFLFLVGDISSWPGLLASLIAFGIGRGTFDSNAMPIPFAAVMWVASAVALALLRLGPFAALSDERLRLAGVHLYPVRQLHFLAFQALETILFGW
jgi:hypothetical protein